MITEIEAHAGAWIVHFASRRWVRTRSISDAWVGACPLVADRASAELHVYGSGENAKFEAWLDNPAG